jgi:hypothetical protein
LILLTRGRIRARLGHFACECVVYRRHPFRDIGLVQLGGELARLGESDFGSREPGFDILFVTCGQKGANAAVAKLFAALVAIGDRERQNTPKKLALHQAWFQNLRKQREKRRRRCSNFE